MQAAMGVWKDCEVLATSNLQAILKPIIEGA